MKFTINGTEYTIEEFQDIRMDNRNRGTSYFWSNGDSEGKPFATILEAQQDAIKHAEALEAEANRDTSMDRIYGSKQAYLNRSVEE